MFAFLTVGCFYGGGSGFMGYLIRAQLLDGETGQVLAGTDYRLDVWIDDEDWDHDGWYPESDQYTVTTETDGTFSEYLVVGFCSVSVGFIPSPPPPPLPEPDYIKVTVVLDECESALVVPRDAVDVDSSVRQRMVLDLGSVAVPPCG
jgi:hypothetical protein